MKFTISQQTLKKYPKLTVGIIICKGINNKKKEERIEHLLTEIEEYVKLNFIPAEIAKHQMIIPWRAAYAEFGTKPTKYHTGTEAMMKRILKGEKIPRVNKIVDLYNYISLKYLIPIGGDDISKIQGDVKLTTAEGTEKFVPLGESKVEHPEKGEIIYKDNRQALSRRWNWRNSNSTRISKETSNAILYVEGLSPTPKKEVEKIVYELSEMIKMYCEGKIEYYLLDLSHSSIEI